VINQLRGLLLERGITIRKGRHHAEAALPQILEDADTNLSGPLRMLLAHLQQSLGSCRVGSMKSMSASCRLPASTRPASGSWPFPASAL
jgi:hypothetical protein